MTHIETDITRARARPNWTPREQAARVLWALVRPLFLCIPRPAWGLRAALLKLFGARLGRDARVCPSARISIPWHLSLGDQSIIGDRVIVYALGPIRIGARVTISQNVHLCAGTHDFRDAAMPLVKAPVTIDDDVWVCADSFVGPGVRIGRGAIVGARAVVMRAVVPGTVVAGNPAREVSRR